MVLTISIFHQIGGGGGGHTSSGSVKAQCDVVRLQQRPTPIFADVDLEFTHKKKPNVPVYLQTRDKVVSLCVVGTNVLVSLGLVFPGVGVVCKGPDRNQYGRVKLVRAERVPSESGLAVHAQVECGEVRKRSVLVDPRKEKLCVEVEPNVRGGALKFVQLLKILVGVVLWSLVVQMVCLQVALILELCTVK